MSTAPLSTLKPFERNYNIGDIGAIYTSIAAFGFNGTLRVWQDGVVVAGNHALKALAGMKRAGEKPPQHITVDADGDWLVPITDVTHLSRQEAEAFAIADNRTRDLAQADPEKLSALLVEIGNADKRMLAATGYDEEDVAELLKVVAGDWPDEPGTGEGEGTAGAGFVMCPVCGTKVDVAG
jgi:hypothetical protein